MLIDEEDGYFNNQDILIAGDTSNDDVLEKVIILLKQKGAGHLRCLINKSKQRAEYLLPSIPRRSSINLKYITYADNVDRIEIVAAHKAAMAAPDVPFALCIVNPLPINNYRIHHILSAFETHNMPVYLYISTD